jgi:hypothetical protein
MIERRSTKSVRNVWVLFSVVLIMTLVAEFFIPGKTPFSSSQWWGFGAVFGFFACTAMVVAAKLLGYLLKRPESYYEDSHD